MFAPAVPPARPRIVIAGGTGFLGRLLSRWFLAAGKEVVVLCRTIPSRPLGGIAYLPWSGRPAESAFRADWESCLDGAAALINLAGRSVNCRYTRSNRRLMFDSRIDSTRALGVALARRHTPPPLWINSSTATIYRHSLDCPRDEQGEIGPTPEARDAFSIDIATAWERALFEAPVPGTIRRVALRTAIVLADEPGTMYAIVRRLVRLGLGGKMGSGRQKVSWIHAADFCRAIDLVIESDLSGPINLAAPHPVTNQEMMRLFRETLGVRAGLSAPGWMLEIGAFFLRTEPELVLKSRFVVPGRLTRAGFQFRYPEMREALESLHHRQFRDLLPSAAPGSLTPRQIGC